MEGTAWGAGLGPWLRLPALFPVARRAALLALPTPLLAPLVWSLLGTTARQCWLSPGYLGVSQQSFPLCSLGSGFSLTSQPCSCSHSS